MGFGASWRRKKEELSPAEIELQGQIDSMSSAFRSTQETTAQFELYYQKIRQRDLNLMPLMQLRQDFVNAEGGMTSAWTRDFLQRTAVVLDDLSRKEKEHADKTYAQAWHPIKAWFQDEYGNFMLDVNRWPKVRREFFEARQKQTSKPSPTTQMALEKAAEKYKMQLEIIQGKLSSQKNIQKHHQHCVSNYFNELLDYHKSFHRSNLEILRHLRRLLDKNKPNETETYTELPPEYLEAAKKRLDEANIPKTKAGTPKKQASREDTGRSTMSQVNTLKQSPK
ncbi:unnamed protein product, partial [Mesorhabditis spiculigera]